MSGSIIIRPAILSDYDDLCALWTILDEQHRVALPNMFRAPTGARREISYVQSLIDGPDSAIFVAAADNKKLLGFATVIMRVHRELTVRPERRFAEVDNIVVKPDLRRTGIGRKLIEASVEWAKTRGLNDLELSVHEFNDEAFAFYRSLGFATMLRRLWRPIGQSN